MPTPGFIDPRSTPAKAAMEQAGSTLAKEALKPLLDAGIAAGMTTEEVKATMLKAIDEAVAEYAGGVYQRIVTAVEREIKERER